jgi:hypothetical protein
MTSRRAPFAAPVRDNGRRPAAGLIALVLATLVIALGSYGLSARVASEAKEAEALARTNAALSRKVDTLSDELRVRMRLPQLQRWNDTGFRMNPVSAVQFLKTPVELGLYASGQLPQMDRAPILVAAPGTAAPPAPAAAPPARAAPPPVPQALPPPGLVLAAAPTPILAPILAPMPAAMPAAMPALESPAQAEAGGAEPAGEAMP